MSDSNLIRVSYIEESTYGVTPSGSLKDLRLTSESLAQETQTVKSREIRSDRQVSVVKRTGIRVGGGLGIEFSYGAYDDLIQAMLLSAAWTAEVSQTDITYSMSSVDNSINDSAAGFVSDGFLVNRWVRISGFTDPANNLYAKIVSVAAGKLVLSGGTVVTEIAGDTVTIKMLSQVVNGTLLKSFSVEKHFTDLSNQYALEKGCSIQQFGLNIAAGEILTGSIDFLGKIEVSGTSSAGSGYTLAPTKEVLSAVDDITSILEAQSIGTFKATSFSFQLQNNLRERTQIGVLGPVSIGKGGIVLTGTMVVYFEDASLVNKYLNFTATSIAVVAEDIDGNGYVFDLPRIRFTAGPRVAPGENSDIMANLSWEAYMHPSELITMRVARYAAA